MIYNIFLGSGDSSVVERRTRDQNVTGSSPGGSGGRISSHGHLSAPTLILVSVPPLCTAVARKRSLSFCQSAGVRLQLNTHAPYVCGFA